MVGVAGWSYPDWRGCFYPLKKDSVPDLARVARTFDCAEINVAFYRTPEARVAEGWLRAVADRPGFLFTSKVPKELTHEEGLDPAGLAAIAAGLKEGLRPLADAGRLGAILLQFPFYFRDGPASRDRIRRLVEAFRPIPVSVELRHRSFFFGPASGDREGDGSLATGPASAIRFLEEIGAGLVNIDVPPGRGTVPPTSVNTSPIGYVRLHGRNARSWFDPKAGRDQKYDYLYSLAELAEWKIRILRLGERTDRTFVIHNNHFRAQAPANALELLKLLGRTPPDPPREILLAYPELAEILGRASQASGIPIQEEIDAPSKPPPSPQPPEKGAP